MPDMVSNGICRQCCAAKPSGQATSVRGAEVGFRHVKILGYGQGDVGDLDDRVEFFDTSLATP